jgi:phosphonate transport system substrate-binding protein
MVKRSLILLAGLSWSIAAQALEAYSLGVVSQRSPVLTAEYWNPILNYVSRKAGVDLKLKIARTGTESSTAAARGEYDFIYSNHIFRPGIVKQGYEVILRPRAEAIKGQIVTLPDSPIKTLADLNDHEIGFPSRSAFVGYSVPVDHLMREGIRFTPVFGGNQEGIMAQLQAGKVLAVGVNNLVMQAYARRVDLHYRVVWESESYNNLPIAVHPRVPKATAKAVRQAFVGMNDDPEGASVLAASAAIVNQAPPFGFQEGRHRDYQNYRDFFKQTVLKDSE